MNCTKIDMENDMIMLMIMLKFQDGGIFLILNLSCFVLNPFHCNSALFLVQFGCKRYSFNGTNGENYNTTVMILGSVGALKR